MALNTTFADFSELKIASNIIDLTNTTASSRAVHLGPTNFASTSAMFLNFNKMTLRPTNMTTTTMPMIIMYTVTFPLIPTKTKANGKWNGKFEAFANGTFSANCNRFQGSILTDYSADVFGNVVFGYIYTCPTSTITLQPPPTTLPTLGSPAPPAIQVSRTLTLQQQPQAPAALPVPRAPPANAAARALTRDSQPPAVLLLCAAGTPVELQAMVWLLAADCASEGDHASVDIAKYFVSPFAFADEPGASALGNVGLAAVIAAVHCLVLILVKLTKCGQQADTTTTPPTTPPSIGQHHQEQSTSSLDGSQCAGTKPATDDDDANAAVVKSITEAGGEVHVGVMVEWSTVASRVLFPGVSILAARVLYLGAAVYGLAGFRSGGSMNILGGFVVVAFLVAVPVLHVISCIYAPTSGGEYVLYDWVSAGVPLWRRWAYPQGRWNNRQVRQRYSWVVTPYQGGCRRWATLTPMFVSFFLFAIPLGAVAPNENGGCTGQYIIPTIGCLVVGVLYAVFRPRRSLPQSLLTAVCYGLVSLVGVAQIVSAGGEEDTAGMKAGVGFILLIVAMLRGLHSLFVVIIECKNEGSIPMILTTTPSKFNENGDEHEDGDNVMSDGENSQQHQHQHGGDFEFQVVVDGAGGASSRHPSSNSDGGGANNDDYSDEEADVNVNDVLNAEFDSDVRSVISMQSVGGMMVGRSESARCARTLSTRSNQYAVVNPTTSGSGNDANILALHPQERLRGGTSPSMMIGLSPPGRHNHPVNDGSVLQEEDGVLLIGDGDTFGGGVVGSNHHTPRCSRQVSLVAGSHGVAAGAPYGNPPSRPTSS